MMPAGRAWRALWQRAPGGKSDWHAAWSSAVIMLPQAIVLATLAGLPSEAGIYASVFSVAVASLVGRCPTLLSGPNTAIALMVSAALAPLAAPLSADYLRLALTLSLLVGLMQLAMAGLRLGRVFQLMPDFVVNGVMGGVGLVLISSQTSTLLGVVGVPGEAPWVSIWRLPATLDMANPFAVVVAAATLAAGFIAPRVPGLRRLPGLVVAMGAGCITCAALDLLWGAARVDLDRIGYMSLQALPLSVPHLDWQELYLLKQLLVGAVGIAFVGVLQTLIIVQGTQCAGEPAPQGADREMAAQGAANVVNAFASAFPGSGSFNRSASHAAAGARTRSAGIGSAAILFGLGFAAAPLIARIPVVALAGTLVLIGVDMLRSVHRRHLRARPLRATWSLWLVGAATLTAGLQSALALGLVLGAWMALWRKARPERPARASDSLPSMPMPLRPAIEIVAQGAAEPVAARVSALSRAA